MTDDASWLRSLLESRRPDPGPVIGEDAVEFDGAEVTWSDITEIRTRIPAEVRYHGLLGTRERFDPAVRQCFGATAQAHGVTICPATDDVMADADPRAKQIKSLLATVRAKIDKLTV
ncbi:MAG TPA: hypothetical protein VFK56_12925 [Mycobacterium sp.]|nr:hypothetical protein [Mycobacterium sp.]